MFGLVETWGMGLNDTLHSLLPQFSIYFCEVLKQARFGRAMAGITVFIRKEYDEFITRVSKDCSFAIFLNCNNACLVLTKMVSYLLSICHRKDHLFIIISTTVVLCFLKMSLQAYQFLINTL